MVIKYVKINKFKLNIVQFAQINRVIYCSCRYKILKSLIDEVITTNKIQVKDM